MAERSGKWAWISLGLMCWAIAASVLAAYYYVGYVEVKKAYEDLRATHEETLGTLSAVAKSLSALMEEVGALRRLMKEILEAGFVNVSLCIDYGNGTVEWHNGTLMPVGSTLFNLTERVTWDFGYVVWPKMGVYVTRINGVEEVVITPGKEGYSWIWYYWDPEAKTWTWGPVACDKHVLHDGEILAWRYEHWSF